MKALTFQQKSSLTYFNKKFQEWNLKSNSKSYNVIIDRLRTTFETYKKINKNINFLDVGCGTGQLAIIMSKKKNVLESSGIDFAKNMITQSKKNNKKLKTKAKFLHTSFFDARFDNKFDLIAAHGFIEYISQNELISFFKILSKITSKNGYISIGSRNRLFNLFSANEFTINENITDLKHLINESIQINKFTTIKNFLKKKLHTKYKIFKKHPITGVTVSQRNQFTPFELSSIIQKYGFKVTQIYPINYHSVLPSLLNNTNIYKSLYEKNALAVSKDFKKQIKLVTSSSSFIIEAKKI